MPKLQWHWVIIGSPFEIGREGYCFWEVQVGIQCCIPPIRTISKASRRDKRRDFIKFCSF